MTAPAQDPVGDDATLEYSIDNSSWTSFATIVEIDGNKVTAPNVDKTILSSAAVGKQPGIPDYGEISAKIVFDKTITPTILGWMNNKTSLYFRASINDGTGNGTNSTEAVAGYVKEFDPFGTLKQNQRVESSITIAVDGAGTFTAGA